MATRRRNPFTTVRAEGAVLPPELLHRIAGLDRELPDLTAASYRLDEGDRLPDAIQRGWTRLRSAWVSFQAALAKTPEQDAAVALTRERWLLPLFDALGFGRLAPARAIEIDDKSFPVSHGWGQHVALHLVGARVPLDKKSPGVAGAARTSPHGLVQELLNGSEDHLWGVVTNGLQLRLLRDNVALTRQAYTEFDLSAMFQSEVYADFVLFFLVLHVTRFGDKKPEDCPLERWVEAAKEQGTRALDRLRSGVEQAISALGAGFLAHPGNALLKGRLRRGALDKQDYYRQVLRLVYRLLFMFVAEDRDLLLSPAASAAARDRYERWYSTQRLRRLASRRAGTQHSDLWRQLRLVFSKLGSDDGLPSLGLPALGSFLWSEDSTPDLAGAEIRNRALLDALRPLSLIDDDHVRRTVDWKNLGSEELGSVYESLLELHPDLNAEAGTFSLRTAGGNERKTTGSYYTPDSLVQCLLDSALDPVLDEAAKNQDPEQAILALKVCDPAVGSGHFLIAAAHRIAKRLASVRTGDDEPAPDATRTALRDVIGHCLYGVDVNEMAVELCKVSLWMEALEPGRPLSFLDSRILCGNSLLGTTPALIAQGIPDVALEPLTGDDKVVARALKRQNKNERKSGQLDLLTAAERVEQSNYKVVESGAQQIAAMKDETITDVHQKEARWRRLQNSPDFRHARAVADAWCAAFVWPKKTGAPPAPTHGLFERFRSSLSIEAGAMEEVCRLATSYAFFHWHLAFPEVFRLPEHGQPPENIETGWSGGFDVVLGNPPWERIKLQEQEWFAVRKPEIAEAPNAAARRRMISELRTTEPGLFQAFEADLRRAEGESHIIRLSGRFPLCGRGDVNTYAVFAETNRAILSTRGRVGCIVPSGVATDDTTKEFFSDLVSSHGLVTLYDFENRDGLFAAVDSRMKFCLLTAARSRPSDAAAPQFAFFLKHPSDLRDGERRFTLSAEDLALLNPNTRTCPVFRSRRDAEITKSIYRRVPVLLRKGPIEENPWGVSFMAMFHMSDDSGLFRTRPQLEQDGFRLEGNMFARGSQRFLPLYEAKMLHQFDHRFGDYADQPPGSENTSLPNVPIERLSDPGYSALPRYWVPSSEVDARIADLWHRGWVLCFRGVCRATDMRSVIADIIPRSGLGNSAPAVFLKAPSWRHVAGLAAWLSSFILDFAGRQKMGGPNLNFFILEQFPAPPPVEFDRAVPFGSKIDDTTFGTLLDRIVPRVVELVYTAHDLTPFARDCGYDGPPFRWDEERRFQLRCELDAAFFHLYGISRDDVAYIMDTFPIVRRNDEKRFGTYRTKNAILAILESFR